VLLSLSIFLLSLYLSVLLPCHVRYKKKLCIHSLKLFHENNAPNAHASEMVFLFPGLSEDSHGAFAGDFGAVLSGCFKN
jgi:hypothetical protein